MLEPHRSHLNVEMIANKRGSSQLNVAGLLNTNTFIIQTVEKRCTHFTEPAGSCPGFGKCKNARVSLYIALPQIPPANTACRLGGVEGGVSHAAYTPTQPFYPAWTDVFICENISRGQGIHALRLFLAAGSAHKVAQPSSVNPSLRKSSPRTRHPLFM